MAVSSPGQQIISNTIHKVGYRIPYRPNDERIYVNGNSVLREMAKVVLREPWLVRIQVTCELGLGVMTTHDQTRLWISIRKRAVSGDTVYRNFSVADVLFPTSINMKLKWANRADTSGYVEETLSEKRFYPGDTLVCDIPVSSYNPDVDTLMVHEVELFYDSTALQTFLDRLDLIHDYYASVVILDSLRNFTGNIELDKPGSMPYNYLKAEELGSVLATISSRDFQGRLLQNGYDPLGLMGKYQQMFRHSRSLVYNLMDELKKTGAISWDGDADRLSGYFTSRVYSYVNRSFLMDQQQGRIYKDCLDHLFDQSAFPPGEDVCGSMLTKMFPDAASDTIARFISKRVYQSYGILAARLMEQSQYAEAFSVMENGRRFIKGNASMAGFEADDLLQSQAAAGIWNSYISIAATCIRGHKYNMAESYLSKADQYALTHAKYIRSDSSYRAVFSQLFFLRNTDCDQLLEKKMYADALECYQQFENSYSQRDLAVVGIQLNEKKSMAKAGLGNLSALRSEDALQRKDSDTALYYYEKAKALRKEVSKYEKVDSRLDSLAPIMARIKYDQIVKEGALALEKRQYTLAVSRLREAKSMAGNFGFDRSREFDSLYRQSMKHYLIVQLSASQKKIWDNQFDSAHLALQKTEAAGYDFGLLGDPDFIAATERYKLRIREQLCRNLQDSVNLGMIRADRSIAARNFTNALLYLEQALVFARQMPECNLDERQIRDSVAKYKPAANYQQNLLDVGSFVAAGNYPEAVNGLFANQEIFRTQDIRKFGLQLVDCFSFIIDRGNPYLTEAVIKYYVAGGNNREASSYLVILYNQGFPASSAAAIQIQLGVNLAQEDFEKSPTTDVSQNVAKYIPDEGWYESFGKAYRGEWNRLTRKVLKSTN